jgi:acyl-CoA synthetase (NDP forming)
MPATWCCGTASPFPGYAYPRSAARALGHAARYGSWRALPPGHVPELADLRAGDARALISAFLGRSPGGGWLTATDTAKLLMCYGIAEVATQLVTDEQDAAGAAAKLCGAVVLKAEVAGLVHTSDAGPVRLDPHGRREVRAGYCALAERSGPRMSGAILQPLITGGTEVIMGVVAAQAPVTLSRLLII